MRNPTLDAAARAQREAVDATLIRCFARNADAARTLVERMLPWIRRAVWREGVERPRYPNCRIAVHQYKSAEAEAVARILENRRELRISRQHGPIAAFKYFATEHIRA